jgi:hypothetical protein
LNQIQAVASWVTSFIPSMSPTTIRQGYVEFGTTLGSTLQLTAAAANDKAQFLTSLGTLTRATGTPLTYTWLAVEYVRDTMLPLARPTARKVVVMLTDGAATDVAPIDGGATEDARVQTAISDINNLGASFIIFRLLSGGGGATGGRAIPATYMDTVVYQGVNTVFSTLPVDINKGQMLCVP